MNLALRDVTLGIVKAFDLKGGMKGIIGGLDTFRATAVPMIVGFVSTVAGWFKWLWAAATPIVSAIFSTLIDWAKKVVSFAVPYLMQYGQTAMAIFKAIGGAIWDGLKAVGSAVA